MRIVSGLARGRRLQAPRGASTRPTSDRVREALFSTIQSRLGDVNGARVLDLYAGSGAMGLEAMSRGAASAVFVESDRSVVHTLKENIERVGLPGTQAVAADVSVFARELPDRGRLDVARYPFDLVICDPPYVMAATQVAAVITDLVRSGWLAADCVIVVERNARDEVAPWPQGVIAVDSSRSGSDSRLEELDRRTYGDTALWYGRLVECTT